jgi:hypothetical protein
MPALERIPHQPENASPWGFTGSRLFSHAAEERAQKLVAVQFFLLAP